ncbi:MAG: hypothetical protein CK424_07895 [Legionella sp.]|nr:MAG: hypothetical protein CK424_07895 [Legionella sp.]
MSDDQLNIQVIAAPFWSILVDNLKEAIIILNDEFSILLFNSYAEKLFSIPTSDALNVKLEHICQKSNIKYFIKNHILKPIPFSIKIPSDVNNGNIAWSFSAVNIQKSIFYLLISSGLQDKMLQNEIFKLETLIENTPCNVYWMDEKCTMIDCNRNVLNMLNLTKEQFKGKSYEELSILCNWPEGLALSLKKDDLDVLNTGKAITAKEDPPIPNAKGGEFNFLTSRMPLRNKEGKIIGVAGISTDVTALKEAKRTAEAASNAKTEFIANMSHDIRTPLSGVVGLGIIAEQEIENPSPKAKVHDMVKSADELLNMLNKFLDIVSIGNITVNDIHEEPFDLHYLVQTILDLEQSSVDLKNIQLLQAIDTNIPPILIGDHDKIHHIILNLVGNAIKFTKTGHVNINIKLVETHQDKAQILFEITDTGIGIPAESLGKVFELFYKVSPSYKGLDKGHGVGLHIVKTYTQLLGGNIFVESTYHEGSKFSFTLSLKIADQNTKPQNISHASLTKPATEPPICTSTIASQHTANAPEILIIEDNPIALTIAQTLIQQTKCNPTPAGDGELALELAKSKQFNLILSDVGLPGISGVEFAKQFRDFEKQHHKKCTPIIAVTAHAEGKMHDECIAAGMNDVTIKPLNIEKLTNIYKQFSVFPDTISSSTNDASLGPLSVQNASILGVDLPNTEDELFVLDHVLIFDAEAAKKVLGEDSTLLTTMLKLTVDTIPNELAHLKNAHEANDWEKVAKVSHKLKGGFLSIGLSRAATACQYLERYYKAGHAKLLENLYEQVIKILAETTEKLKSLIK